MTLNQLRSFLAVADSGSVRAAAEELVVTQAAVSASITALQKSLGVALVTPDGRGLRLTDAGAAYARYARRILGLLDEAGRAAAAAADPERGELRIAAVTTAAEQILPPILGGFRRRHPQTGVRLEAGNRDRVRSLLDRHQVDLVLGGRPEPGWDVVVHGVRRHELVVVAAPELAAAAQVGHGKGGPQPASPDAPPRPRRRTPGHPRPAVRRFPPTRHARPENRLRRDSPQTCNRRARRGSAGSVPRESASGQPRTNNRRERRVAGGRQPKQCRDGG